MQGSSCFRCSPKVLTVEKFTVNNQRLTVNGELPTVNWQLPLAVPDFSFIFGENKNQGIIFNTIYYA